MNYYEISEETARTAHSMVHMSDYKPGSATDGYRAAVDEAAALVLSDTGVRFSTASKTNASPSRLSFRFASPETTSMKSPGKTSGSK